MKLIVKFDQPVSIGTIFDVGKDYWGRACPERSVIIVRQATEAEWRENFPGDPDFYGGMAYDNPAYYEIELLFDLPVKREVFLYICVCI